MTADLATFFKNPLRVRVLAYVLRTPVPGSAATIAKAIKAPRVAVQRELAALARTKLLIARPPRKAPHYAVDEAHVLVSHLRALLEEAMNPTDKAILAAFRGTPGLVFLVATGVLARDDRGAVDLLIVCRNPHSRAVPRSVGRVERLAGLPMRYSVMSPEEYVKRRQSFDRMLRDVLDFSHRILVMKLPQGSEVPLG